MLYSMLSKPSSRDQFDDTKVLESLRYGWPTAYLWAVMKQKNHFKSIAMDVLAQDIVTVKKKSLNFMLFFSCTEAC